MKKILIAYDGSKTSKKAIKDAEMRALSLISEEIEINLLSVCNTSNSATNVMMQRNIKDEEVQKIKAQHDMTTKEEHLMRIKDELNEVKKRFEQKGVNIKVKVKKIEGNHNPGKNICEYAEDNEMDLIVVGSRGLGNVKKIFLGSVSNYVVNNAKVPVLVTK